METFSQVTAFCNSYSKQQHAGGATCPAVSVSAVVDLFSEVLTELLPGPDMAQRPPTGRPPPVAQIIRYSKRVGCGEFI